MKYGDNRLKRITRFLHKWFRCSWYHRNHRCHPEVHLVNPIYWHCTKCHDCGEAFDLISGKTKRTWF